MGQRRALSEAIAAIEAGDKLTGRQLLSQILRSDPSVAEAWLWMSRIAESDVQRQECLRRALSPSQPGAPGPRAPADPTRPSDEASPVVHARAEFPVTGTLQGGDVPARPASTTRSPIQTAPPPLSDTQRQVGQRNVMLAGAMTFSLLCGLTVLISLLLTTVPTAQERMRERYAALPYEAVVWCLSCEQSGEPVVLRDRPGRLLSHRAGTLAHGTRVTVVGEEWVELEGCVYAEVRAASESGWVRSAYLHSVR